MHFRRWQMIGGMMVGLALTRGPRAAEAKKLTLPELLDMARAGNPSLQAGAAATIAVEAQVSEARRNWLPQGDLLSVVAPSPNMQCYGPHLPGEMGVRDASQCVSTQNAEVSITNVSWSRVFTRTEVRLVQPLWDFGKISAGIEAGQAGAAAMREKTSGTRAEIEMNVRRAYWGLKAAREAMDALDEGKGFLDEAQTKVEKGLADGTGNFTVTDKLRLRTSRADLETRILEARKIADIARDGLRALLGSSAPAELEVDDDPVEPVEVAQRPVTYYEDQARWSRPEVRALNYAVKAKRALALLERRKEYPDLVLIGSAAFARAQAVDDPQNGFLSHYFNSTTAGLAAAVRMPLDLGPKLARADRVRAEADEMEYRREEALGGIIFEVRRAYSDLVEASARVAALDKGAKAGKSWISAVAQNLAVGLSEARDFTDALTQFFQMRVRYLQAVADMNVAAAALVRATGATAL